MPWGDPPDSESVHPYLNHIAVAPGHFRHVLKRVQRFSETLTALHVIETSPLVYETHEIRLNIQRQTRIFHQRLTIYSTKGGLKKRAYDYGTLDIRL